MHAPQVMVDGLGRILCMSEVQEAPKPGDQLQYHRNKQKDKNKKSKHPSETKYNKFEQTPAPISFDFTGGGNNCNNVGAQQAFLYQQQTPSHVNHNTLPRNQHCSIEASGYQRTGGGAGGGGGAHNVTLENDVREIKKMLRTYITRLNENEYKSKINKEWRIVARVLDRLFFCLYVAVIVLSLATIFPKG